ncbi:MAG: M48 family metalloprotease [Chlamydiia bacterium]|nr:M48 family metalloprotease [Chlamydiia bacterium]
MSEINEIIAVDSPTAAPAEREEEASTLSKVINGFATPFIAAYNFLLPKNPVTGKREIWYIPKPVESLMGRVMYPIMKSTQGGEMEHLFSEKCRQVMQRLATHTKREFNYEVAVLNSNVINAWCLPGGKVAVYKTLLEKIDYYINNKDELGLTGYTHPKTGEFISYASVTKEDVIAALLGHEMTHADARHSVRKLEWSFLVQAAAFGLNKYTQGVIDRWEQDFKTRQALAENPHDLDDEKDKLQAWKNIHAIAFSRLTQLGVHLYFLAGSRGHELEADKYGTELAIKAGYDPAGALFLQEILKQESHETHSFLPESFHRIQSIFQTHPSSTERQLALFHDIKVYKQGT